MLTPQDASLKQDGCERHHRGKETDDSAVSVSNMHIHMYNKFITTDYLFLLGNSSEFLSDRLH